MLPEYIIYFAISLNLIGHIFYIKSIIKGHAKPNLASWIPWVLAPFLGAFFQIQAGAGLSVLPILMAGFGSLIIMLAGIFTKNALWKMSLFDMICGLFSLFSLMLYMFTHNLEISIVFAILSDGLAFIPTYVKAWKSPESESIAAYSWAILSNVIGLLIIKNYTFVTYSFGTYLVIGNILMIFIMYRKKIFKKFA